MNETQDTPELETGVAAIVSTIGEEEAAGLDSHQRSRLYTPRGGKPMLVIAYEDCGQTAHFRDAGFEIITDPDEVAAIRTALRRDVETIEAPETISQEQPAQDG